jgi:hypothetical protein
VPPLFRSPVRWLPTLGVLVALWWLAPALIFGLAVRPELERAALGWPRRLHELERPLLGPEADWPELRLGPLGLRVPRAGLRYVLCRWESAGCLFRYPGSSLVIELRSLALQRVPPRPWDDVVQPLALASSEPLLLRSRATAELLLELGRMRLDPVLRSNLDVVGYAFARPGHRGLLLDLPGGGASVTLFADDSDLQASLHLAVAEEPVAPIRQLAAGMTLRPGVASLEVLRADLGEIERRLPRLPYLRRERS